MEILLYIGSILSIATLSIIPDLYENSHMSESKQYFEFTTVQDSSRNNLLIKVDSFYLEIISPSSGVQFYKSGIIFLVPTKKTAKMVSGQISFGTTEAYVAIPGDSTLGMKYLFSAASSFSYPCDAFTFNKGFNIMYYTKYSKTSGKEQIYQAAISNENNKLGDWTEKTEPLTFCNDSSNYSHPALSADGESMIFASDRKGSYGGMDLFITKKEGESWSAPQSMGNEINTNGNETFPFLDLSNNLFFSSNGLPGLGGYDIFMCKFNGKNWDKPFNLTKLINSRGDELAFTINKNDQKSGFFTSRQKSGKMINQLYKISLGSIYKIDSLKNISEVLYNSILQRPHLTAMKSDDSTKLIKAIIVEEKKVVKPVQLPVKEKTVVKPENKTPEPKVAVTTKSTSTTEVKKQVVIYRIQFAASVTSKGSYKITINNKSYSTFEYFYKGAYRTTIGEFNSLSEATALQNTLRKSGYPSSFVAAFINNERSLDPALFK
jgi:hypothetical protein